LLSVRDRRVLSLQPGGHDETGAYHGLWELNFFLVNDEGKVTHFECWNDSQGFDVLTEKVFGVPGSHVKSLADYIQLFETVGAKYETEGESHPD
jgi:hypothetical protein